MTTTRTRPSRLDTVTVLRALADPVRLELVRQLRTSGEPIACGMFKTHVAKNTLSHHFKTLREAGVIVTYQEAGRSFNVLQQAALDEAFPGLLDAIVT